jgi:hypothetical protein
VIYSRNKTTVPITHDAGWASQLVSAIWGTKSISRRFLESNVDLARSLVTKQNDVTRLVFEVHAPFIQPIVETSGVPKFLSFDKAEPNSQFGGKYIRNNLIRIRGSLTCKLSGTLTRGLTPPDPRSLCPLSSTEFVEPPRKNSWLNRPSPKKLLGTPLVETKICLDTSRSIAESTGMNGQRHVPAALLLGNVPHVPTE